MPGLDRLLRMHEVIFMPGRHQGLHEDGARTSFTPTSSPLFVLVPAIITGYEPSPEWFVDTVSCLT